MEPEGDRFEFLLLKERPIGEVSTLFYGHPYLQAHWHNEGTHKKGKVWESKQNPAVKSGHLNLQEELTYKPLRQSDQANQGSIQDGDEITGRVICIRISTCNFQYAV
jgi:hypothetical protein